jgi:BirA family transcriptional regulator, biotin operon repressor / biotin---[acetyl-CoA-carboxylase] ligase
MTTEPRFPPLLTGHAVTGRIDPFEKAISLAVMGCDAGTIVHNITNDHLRAAFVFAPEVTLDKAAAMLVACSVGYSNAFGALAPPEVMMHLKWDGDVLVNGATCGGLKMAASHSDPAAMANWLVVGLDVPLFPTDSPEGGDTPDQTTLFQEGCAELNPVELLEAWARHTLVWVNRWEDDGVAPLHTEWRNVAFAIGENMTTNLDGKEINGTFLGIDEAFGMLIRTPETTHIKPLTDLLPQGDTT